MSAKIGVVQWATLMSLLYREFQVPPWERGQGCVHGLGNAWMERKGKNIFELADSCSQGPAICTSLARLPQEWKTHLMVYNLFNLCNPCVPIALRGRRRASEPLGLWLQKVSTCVCAENCTRSSRRALTPEPSHLPPFLTLTQINLESLPCRKNIIPLCLRSSYSHEIMPIREENEAQLQGLLDLVSGQNHSQQCTTHP